MRFLLASHNANKLRELRLARPDWEIALLGANDYPPEDAGSYYGNALIKARYGRSVEPAAWIVAEDSGIEVAALDGAPGIASARWAVDGVAALLEALQGVEDRRARYVAELVVLTPDGRELRGSGAVEGTVALAPCGDEGFGYDPIFVPAGSTKTVAQLGNKWKAENSHRARAARAVDVGEAPA